jgi:hypothetical protein
MNPGTRHTGTSARNHHEHTQGSHPSLIMSIMPTFLLGNTLRAEWARAARTSPQEPVRGDRRPPPAAGQGESGTSHQLRIPSAPDGHVTSISSGRQVGFPSAPAGKSRPSAPAGQVRSHQFRPDKSGESGGKAVRNDWEVPAGAAAITGNQRWMSPQVTAVIDRGIVCAVEATFCGFTKKTET